MILWSINIKKIYQHCRYNLQQWGESGNVDILNSMSRYVAFAQLRHNLGNVSPAVIISSIWIYE